MRSINAGGYRSYDTPAGHCAVDLLISSTVKEHELGLKTNRVYQWHVICLRPLELPGRSWPRVLQGAGSTQRNAGLGLAGITNS